MQRAPCKGIGPSQRFLVQANTLGRHCDPCTARAWQPADTVSSAECSRQASMRLPARLNTCSHTVISMHRCIAPFSGELDLLSLRCHMRASRARVKWCRVCAAGPSFGRFCWVPGLCVVCVLAALMSEVCRCHLAWCTVRARPCVEEYLLCYQLANHVQLTAERLAQVVVGSLISKTACSTVQLGGLLPCKYS
jgi:hypothetical protein